MMEERQTVDVDMPETQESDQLSSVIKTLVVVMAKCNYAHSLWLDNIRS